MAKKDKFDLVAPPAQTSIPMATDIFDTNYIADLPEEMVLENKLGITNEVHNHIISLMGMATGVVSAKMLIVAIYRKEGVIIRKSVMNSALAYMCERGLLSRSIRGLYGLPEVGQ